MSNTIDKPETVGRKKRIARRVGIGALLVGISASTGVGTAAAQDWQAPDAQDWQTANDLYEAGSNLVSSGSSAGVLQNIATGDYGNLGEVASPSVVKPAEGTFTSGYGPRWGSFHSGIDIANSLGTPIKAVMSGNVISSGPASGYGNWIRIQHDDGSVSVYGHMQSLYVGVGERVSAGQTIAGMGSEGFSTGSHLHFEIHPDGSTPVDPQPWLAQHGIYL
ncbi:M23 family metallopeptidase [Corynebacterium halotolerans]|uniref:M23 family metallopeptidase n=1 Tax=Corynebacterium halotolerans TaxID=225326 RepID=UPI003CF05F84